MVLIYQELIFKLQRKEIYMKIIMFNFSIKGCDNSQKDVPRQNKINFIKCSMKIKS